VAAFFGAACNADRPTSAVSCDLAYNAAYRARGGGYDDRGAGVERADQFQTHPCGDAGHAQSPQVDRQRVHGSIDASKPACVFDAVALPSQEAGDDVTDA
jgi:hypothetical protein